MTDKPKRKNDDPIPRRYWWIFGTLALVLLIGLRFPVRLKASYDFNVMFYSLIGLGCILTTTHFVRRYHWQRNIVIVMLGCVILIGFNTKDMADNYAPLFDVPCTTNYVGIFTTHLCTTFWVCDGAEYIGLRNIPIVIRTYAVSNHPCVAF